MANDLDKNIAKRMSETFARSLVGEELYVVQTLSIDSGGSIKTVIHGKFKFLEAAIMQKRLIDTERLNSAERAGELVQIALAWGE